MPSDLDAFEGLVRPSLVVVMPAAATKAATKVGKAQMRGQ